MARLGLVWRLALIVVAALAVFQFLAFGAFLIQREQRTKWAYYSLSSEALDRLAALVDFEEVAR